MTNEIISIIVLDIYIDSAIVNGDVVIETNALAITIATAIVNVTDAAAVAGTAMVTVIVVLFNTDANLSGDMLILIVMIVVLIIAIMSIVVIINIVF